MNTRLFRRVSLAALALLWAIPAHALFDVFLSFLASRLLLLLRQARYCHDFLFRFQLDELKKKLDSIRPQRPQEARKVSVLIEVSQFGECRKSGEQPDRSY
jgi:hypothetical protein